MWVVPASFAMSGSDDDRPLSQLFGRDDDRALILRQEKQIARLQSENARLRGSYASLLQQTVRTVAATEETLRAVLAKVGLGDSAPAPTSEAPPPVVLSWHPSATSAESASWVAGASERYADLGADSAAVWAPAETEEAHPAAGVALPPEAFGSPVGALHPGAMHTPRRRGEPGLGFGSISLHRAAGSEDNLDRSMHGVSDAEDRGLPPVNHGADESDTQWAETFNGALVANGTEASPEPSPQLPLPQYPQSFGSSALPLSRCCAVESSSAAPAVLGTAASDLLDETETRASAGSQQRGGSTGAGVEVRRTGLRVSDANSQRHATGAAPSSDTAHREGDGGSAWVGAHKKRSSLSLDDGARRTKFFLNSGQEGRQPRAPQPPMARGAESEELSLDSSVAPVRGWPMAAAGPSPMPPLPAPLPYPPEEKPVWERLAGVPNPPPTQQQPWLQHGQGAQAAPEAPPPPPPPPAQQQAAPAARGLPSTGRSKVPVVAEVVRNQAERARMPAHYCADCEPFFTAVGYTGPELACMHNNCSRHRRNHPRNDTPTGFWDLPSQGSGL